MTTRPTRPARALRVLPALLLLGTGVTRATQAPAGPGVAPLFGADRGLELTLEAALQISAENNLGVKIEELNTEIALQNFRGAWGAFDWRIDARAGLTDAEYQPRDVFGGSSENTREITLDLARPLASTGGTFRTHFGTKHTKTNSAFQVEPQSTSDVISLSYVQPLLRGAWHGYATSTQREAELEWQRADERLRQRKQKLLLDVGNAYWDLVNARENLGVAESSLVLARDQVDLNQRRLDAGMGTDFEVLQAEAAVATREEDRLLADVRVRQAADALKNLLFPGSNTARWETSLVPTTPLPEPVAGEATPGWETALQVAIERRSDLRQQRLAVEVARVKHDRTQNERRLGLDLELTASSQGFSGDSSKALDTTLQYDFPTYEAALVFNYALGNTRARHADRAAWAALRAARLAYDDLEATVAMEVRESVRQVRYQAEAVRAADKSLELARRQLTVEESRFRAESSTTFQVKQFQQDLAQAMYNARNARANYAKSRVALLSAQGLLGDARQP